MLLFILKEFASLNQCRLAILALYGLFENTKYLYFQNLQGSFFIIINFRCFIVIIIVRSVIIVRFIVNFINFTIVVIKISTESN